MKRWLWLVLWLFPEVALAGTLTLTWTDNADNETEFRVYRRPSADPTYTLLVTLPADTEQYVDASVVPNISYTYRVTAANSAGESAPTNEGSGIVVLADVGPMPPIALVSVEVTDLPLNAGLVLAFDFEEGTGNVTFNSANGLHGQITGAQWTTGKNGSGLVFDGSDDFVVTAWSATTTITGTEITLAAWIFPHTSGATGGSRIISKRTDAGGSDVYALLLYQSQVWFRVNGVNHISTSLPVNTWTHVVGVYDGIDTRIYLNGVQEASVQPFTAAIQGSSLGVFVGHREGEERYFDGVLDEIRVWDRALTAQEVTGLFAGG